MKSFAKTLFMALCAIMLCASTSYAKGTGGFPTTEYMLRYAEFIMSNEDLMYWIDSEDHGYESFTLLNIDDDDIPEMVLAGESNAQGYVVLTQHDGNVDVIFSPGPQITCILGTGLCGYDISQWDQRLLNVYHIEKGKFVKVIEYNSFAEYMEEGDEEFDDFGAPITPYRYLNGVEVGMASDLPEKTFEQEYYSKGEVLDWSPTDKPLWEGTDQSGEVKATSEGYSTSKLMEWARQTR